MTVRIPIQADPSDAINAVAAVKAALRGMGDEGRALADADFNKILGMDDLLRNIGRVKENLQDLARVGRGETATAARAMFGRNPGLDALYNLEEEASKRFPEGASRARFTRSVGSYALRGTAFDPANFGEQYGPPPPPEQFGPPPPPNPGPPPPPEPPKPPTRFKFDGDEIGSALKNGLLGGIGFFLAQAGLSSVASFAGSAIQAGEGENTATDALLRRTGDLADSFDQLTKDAGAFSKGLLVSRIDMERYAGAYAAASGVTDAGSIMRATRLGVGMANGFGIDPGGMMQAMGHASFLGMEPEKFAEMVGESAVRGSMGGRVEEVMGALLHWTDNASRVSATGAALTGNVAGFTDLWTAMQASGNPMFRGSNGVQVIDQINSSITGGGGGGLAGQVLSMRALMGAGITDPAEAQLTLAGGAFSTLKSGPMKGRTLFNVLSGELGREYANQSPAARAIAAGTYFGLNPLVAQQLGSLGGGGEKVDLAKLNETLAGMGGINAINPTSLPDIIRAQNASPEQLETMRRHLLAKGANAHLTAPNAKAIGDAKGGEDLRHALITGLAQAGMPATDASRALEAQNKMTDQMATLGRTLIDVITPLKNNIGDLAEKAAPLFDWARDQLQPSVPLDPTDGAVKLGNPQSMPGANRDWGSFNAGAQTAVPTSITSQTGMLTRIGQQESGMGTASGNIFGEIPSSFVNDVRMVSKTDKDVANAIDGKSDAEIAAMRTLQYADLQRKAAGYHLMQVDKIAKYHSMLGRYAVWNLGTKGNDVMDAPPNAKMWDFVGAGDRAMVPANSPLRTQTVGEWKRARSNLFPADMPAPTGAVAGNVGSAGGMAVSVNGGEPIRILLQDSRAKLHHEVTAPLSVSGDPLPSGTAPQVNGASHAFIGPMQTPSDRAAAAAAARDAKLRSTPARNLNNGFVDSW